MSSKLLPHQIEGVRKLIKFNGRALIADEMQTGKTIQVLKYIKYKKQSTVVICPAIAKWVWKNQAREHINTRATIIEGTKPPKRNLLVEHKILIINYDILPFWKEYLLNTDKKILIADECHKTKNEETNRTEHFKIQARKVPHVIALSGTPLVNRPKELWPVINVLRPDIFNSFLEYAFRYCEPKYIFGRWEYNGASHLKELHHKLKKHLMIRRLKDEVLPHLKSIKNIIIPMGIKKRKDYNQASDDIVKWLTKTSINKARKAKKAPKLVRLGYLRRLAADYKIKNVYKWMDRFLEKSDEKIVLFAIHQKIIGELHERYKNISVVIDGKLSAKKKHIAELIFKRNNKIRILIGNIQAASEAIALSKHARYIGFVEIGWTPGEHNQAACRVHGLGQDKQVKAFWFIARGTIEEYLCEILEIKQGTLSSVLDGDADVNSLNVFSELEKRITRASKKLR